jgi:CBS domain-containing protein
MPLRHEGIIASDPEEIDLLQTVTVDAVMTTDPRTVPPDMPLAELRATVREIGHAVPVVDEGGLLNGVVAIADLPSESEGTGMAEAGSPTELEHQLTAADVCTRHPVTVAPTDPCYRAMRRMASLDIGMVPVVDPRQPERLAGVVRREDLVEAYRQAANRSLGAQQRREASQLRDLGGARFLELAVHAGAPVAECAVRDVPWPDRAVLTGVHRDGELILPDGNTVLEAGDRLIVLTDRANADEIRRLVRPEDGNPERSDGQ